MLKVSFVVTIHFHYLVLSHGNNSLQLTQPSEDNIREYTEALTLQ